MKWEYKRHYFRIEQNIVAENTREEPFGEEFDALGAEGWELVQILFRGDDALDSGQKMAVFKRPKQ